MKRRADALLAMSDEARRAWLDGMPPAALRMLMHDWRFWARAKQLPPEGDAWRLWILLAGRGFGKTRAGAEWVRMLAESAPGIRIALVAATQAEARAVMVEGDSGLLAIAPQGRRPAFEPSLRRLRWPNGALAFIYSAEEPDGLRGPQHHAAWCDELAKWRFDRECWMNLDMGLRLGSNPRACITTTPRPTALLRQLLAREDAVLVRGASHENHRHLPEAFLAAMDAHYGGTRLGRQELLGELIEEPQGALWSRALLDRCREGATPALVRVVVGVDPPVTSGDKADACGIVAAGLDAKGHGHVLRDDTLQGASPDGWARAVVQCARVVEADRVIAEANNGGELVRSVLHQVEPNLPVTLVRASRGKVARAEPVAALYEQGRVHHVGAFAALEDELAGLCLGGAYQGPGHSPDRADAMVWALTHLMLERQAEPLLRSLA